MKLVYQGGQHKIFCDGVIHWCIDKWDRKTKDSKCWCKTFKTAQEKIRGING